MEQQAIVELLGKSALFGSLAETDRGAIASGMRRVQFDPDQMIFSRGDPAREMYLVLEGKVRLSILTSDGRELSFAHDHATFSARSPRSTAASGPPVPPPSAACWPWYCRRGRCWI